MDPAILPAIHVPEINQPIVHRILVPELKIVLLLVLMEVLVLMPAVTELMVIVMYVIMDIGRNLIVRII